MAKEGSTVSGLMDCFATAISLSLQHGVPLKVLCEKFAHTRFEPSGWTGNEQIGYAKSIMDYIFRWIQLRFLSGTQLTSSPGWPRLRRSRCREPSTHPKALSSWSVAMKDPLSSAPPSTPCRSTTSTTARPKGRHRPGPAGQQRPELSAAQGNSPLSLEDRGIYHAADAMKDLYDMGDSPSCATCGSIMTRSGSCYRCMSCGSTSGCGPRTER